MGSGRPVPHSGTGRIQPSPKRKLKTPAHLLIDEANVDLIFSHSFYHFKSIETYKGKFIIYGAGDFINDYEGIEEEL
jgi:poly-gamma-glutamate capsule biosynthesis protein CapA/YwtB (metallophosphatase superfamily)